MLTDVDSARQVTKSLEADLAPEQRPRSMHRHRTTAEAVTARPRGPSRPVRSPALALSFLRFAITAANVCAARNITDWRTPSGGLSDEF